MTDRIRSAELMVKNALSNPDIISELKQNPEQTLKKLEKDTLQQIPRVLEQDPLIYRIVVSALSMTIILVVLGAVAISYKSNTNTPIPDVLTALASAAIGALAGLLAPSPLAK